MGVLVTGVGGLLGGWLYERIVADGVAALGVPGPSSGFDFSDPDDVEGAFEAISEVLGEADRTIVLHCAALSAIADCAKDPARAHAANVEGTRNVASWVSRHGARLVHVSTDLVFDGEAAPYAEDATTAPTSIYGKTKLEAESAAREAPDSVVVRVSLLFGPTKTERKGFFDATLAAFRDGKPITLFDDEWRTPLSLRAAADALWAIARSDVRGLLHVGGPERMSRLEMGERIARHLALPHPAITRASRTSVPGEPRPRDVSLDRSRFDARFPDIARASFEEECERMLSPKR
jgi:dTDP-4-dehydrorhamnose reductase